MPINFFVLGWGGVFWGGSVGTRHGHHLSFWRSIAIFGPIEANPCSEANCGVVTVSLVL